MGSKSQYLEKKMIDVALKQGTFTSPTNLYIALCKSTITDTHTGATLPSEVSGGSYARKKCNTWDAGSVAGGVTISANAIAITFVQATAVWGTVTDFAIVDSVTAAQGNVHYYGKLTTPKRIVTNDTAKFATGDIDISEE